MPVNHANFKPCYIVNNTVTTRGRKDMKKGFTIVLTFSRPWCVHPFFRNFEKMEFDRRKCHIIIYNNTNDPFLDKKLLFYAHRYQRVHKQKWGERRVLSSFASVRLFKSFRKYGGIVFGQEATWDKSKLPTIYAMQKDIVGMITTKTFMQIEDDTLPPAWAVKFLMRKLKSDSKIGIVSGVEPTRSPHLTDKVRVGAYYLKRPGAIIYERISIDPKLRGFQDVDAVGFYCNCVRTEAWKKAYKIMERELERQKTAEPNWAIDTLWTNNVKRAGYRVIADMNTPCLHMQSVGDRIYHWALDRAVQKLDYYIRKYRTYAQNVDIHYRRS